MTRIKPPKHLAHCAEADGLMDVYGPCHRAFIEKLKRQRAGLPAVVKVSASRAAHGAVGIVKAAAKIDSASGELVASRAVECEACPHLKLIRPKMAGVALPVQYMGCEKCGCRYQSKIRNAKETCPEGKW